MPSKRPPVGWVSKWLPDITGRRLGSLPGRRAKILPTLSTVTVQPASSAHLTNRSRPWPSNSVPARRATPPFGVAPILAISIKLSHKRALLIFRFCMVSAPPLDKL